MGIPDHVKGDAVLDSFCQSVLMQAASSCSRYRVTELVFDGLPDLLS